MKDEMLAGIVSELIESQGVALGLVVSAIAEQLDADRLAQALQQRLDAAKNQKAYPALAGRIATHALDAALAVAQKQRKASH